MGERPHRRDFDFHEVMHEALTRTGREHPYSMIFEAVGYTGPEGGLRHDCYIAFEFYFWLPQNKHLKLEFASGTFARSEVIKSPAPRDRETIGLPLPITITRAIEILKREGWEEPFVSTQLYFRRFPGVTEAQYVFRIPAVDGPVCVGARSGSVWKE